LKNQNQPIALSVNKGVEYVNEPEKEKLTELRNKRKIEISIDTFIEEILKGNIIFLSKAVTLIESTKREHGIKAQEIINRCIPYSGNSVRIGFTGVPGAGKSSFIEALGMFLVNTGKRVAVLAVDPSSKRSGGSILGDKTRMEQLSVSQNAFIRPSPAGGNLGGVARKTAETIILCEAAGFDIIFVETVGVGQSEIAVHSMVDFFLLLMIAGAGDELQGIKRGITETADIIVINKADGDNIKNAERAKMEYQNALHYFPLNDSGLTPQVATASALTGDGIESVWNIITDYINFTKHNHYFYDKRKTQAKYRMLETIDEEIKRRFYNNEHLKSKLKGLESKVLKGEISPYFAAYSILGEKGEI
jgi:LAO/AO transport system kinase